MRRSIIVGMHIGLWVSYMILTTTIFGILSISDIDESSINYFCDFLFGFAMLPAFLSFYGFYFLLFPDYLKHKKPTRSILIGAGIALTSGIFGFSSIYSNIGPDAMINGSWFCRIASVFFMGFIGIINGIIALVLKGFITWSEEIKLKETLKQKNHEMEMALVKSQLDPHFLFNTINNIDVLILKNAEMASEYLNKLSDIMRFMLFETKTAEITLSKEIEYINKYIELQKIRTANSNYVNYSVSGDPKGKTIAPMVFIPFIENAFKHTNNKKIEHAITINILIEPDFVRLECINKFDSTRVSKTESNGLGNDLIKKRLNLIYPDRHQLKVIHQTDLYTVFLTIKADNEKV